MQIAEIFDETAAQEKEHAKRFFSFLEGGKVEIIAVFPAGKTGTALENLKAAEAPKICPACLHPQSYFELLGENW